MSEKKEKLVELSVRIHNLKKHIYELIDKKNDLLDPEILAASKMLDALLNEYDKLINDKIGTDN